MNEAVINKIDEIIQMNPQEFLDAANVPGNVLIPEGVAMTIQWVLNEILQVAMD